MASLTGNHAAVVLQGVTRRYGSRTVVDDVTLSIQPGERFALLGHNGAGKTTLIKMMLGICRVTAGDIQLLGHAVGDGKGGPDGIGYLPESVAFHGSLTAREVMQFYARLKSRPRQECAALLERVGLGAAIDQRVRTYSKGMRQRLGLAQALLGDPQLLLLDEPTTGLDPDLRKLFYEVVDERVANGATPLISSHALAEIEHNIDRIAILKNGVLVVQGSLRELRAQAQLATTIRVTAPAGGARSVADALGDAVDIHRVNDHVVELGCTDDRKLETLRRIGLVDRPVLDVDILPVSLEQLYNHYTTGGPDA